MLGVFRALFNPHNPPVPIGIENGTNLLMVETDIKYQSWNLNVGVTAKLVFRRLSLEVPFPHL